MEHASTPPTHSLLTVVNASKALRGEAALKRATVEAALIPVPRSISQECGVCLQVRFGDRERAVAALEAAGVQPSAIHDLDMEPTQRDSTDGSPTTAH
jgi:hypothetical protein